ETPPRRPGSVQGSLEVAAKEGLFRQGDDEELAGDIVEDRPGPAEGERVSEVPEIAISEVERRKDDGGEAGGPQEGRGRLPQEALCREALSIEQAAERYAPDPRVALFGADGQKPCRRKEHEADAGGSVALGGEPRDERDDSAHHRGRDEG